MNEKQILARVGELVDEEHELRRLLQSGEVRTEEEQQRLRQLEASLDQCWDLLRRRRALRDSGQDPDRATAASLDQVERYLQ